MSKGATPSRTSQKVWCGAERFKVGEKKDLRCCRGGRIGIVRPSVGREVLEGEQMIACCFRLVKAMLGEPGDALRLRELKARG